MALLYFWSTMRNPREVDALKRQSGARSYIACIDIMACGTCCVITLTVEVIYFSIKTYPPIPCLQPTWISIAILQFRPRASVPEMGSEFNCMHARDILTVYNMA